MANFRDTPLSEEARRKRFAFLVKEERVWMAQAVCKGLNPNIFLDDYAKAAQICADCPVRWECFQYSLYVSPVVGIFGGLSENGRKAIRSAWRNHKYRAIKRYEQALEFQDYYEKYRELSLRQLLALHKNDNVYSSEAS